MNEVAVMCNQLQQNSNAKRDLAKTIYAFCRSVTPQFYKQSVEEMNAAVTSIQMLIQGIREDVLAKMCQIAIREYPKTRAGSANSYFDINYILRFYDMAWNEARPEEYKCICKFDKADGRIKIGYCKDEDYDFENYCAFDGAEIWWDER